LGLPITAKKKKERERERSAFHLRFNLAAEHQIMTLFSQEDDGGYGSTEARVKM
jgi:hypothetical protein